VCARVCVFVRVCACIVHSQRVQYGPVTDADADAAAVAIRLGRGRRRRSSPVIII